MARRRESRRRVRPNSAHPCTGRRAPGGQVVHGHVAELSVAVDDVGGVKGHISVGVLLDEAAEVEGNLVSDFAEHGDLHGAEAFLLTVLLGVLHMGEVGVDEDANGLGLLSLVVVLADLGGSHEGEVEGPEENIDVLALEDVVVDLLNLLPIGPGRFCF